MMKNILDDIKWFFQRLFRGYSDNETWNIDITVCQYMLPRLKALLDRRSDPRTCISHPGELKSPMEWDKILNKILFSVEMTANDNKDEPTRQQTYLILEGFELMGKYFTHLWD